MISVLENRGRKLHTTNSWRFLGVEDDEGIPSNSIWNAAQFGRDMIIANIDTGFIYIIIFFFFFCSIINLIINNFLNLISSSIFFKNIPNKSFKLLIWLDEHESIRTKYVSP